MATLREWLEAVEKLDDEDIDKMVEALDALEDWNLFFVEFTKGAGLGAIKQMLKSCRAHRAMERADRGGT